jgi:hypothetical protein
MARLSLLLLLFLAASCAEQSLAAQPLPELMSPEPGRLSPISVADPVLVNGERLAWDVSWRGLQVGRVQLAVGNERRRAVTVTSEFTTAGMAARMAPMRHQLTTLVDGNTGLPLDGIDILVTDGVSKRAEYTNERFRSDEVHTFHSALAVLRAWAKPNAKAGYVMVLHQRDLYRVDVASPTVEDQRLRVDGSAAESENSGKPIAITLWFSLDAARVPLALEVEDGRGRVAAELIERETL